MEASTPISTFLRTETATPITVDALQRERSLNVSELLECVQELRPVVQNKLQENRSIARQSASRGDLPNFTEGYYVLVAREDFFAGEKLTVRWRGPRRIIKALNDYVFQVEDLRNGRLEDVHGRRLKFYRDGSLNQKVILSHVLSSETGMPVARLLRLKDTEDGLHVVERWKGLPDTEDTLEPIERVFEDLPEMVKRVFAQKHSN